MKLGDKLREKFKEALSAVLPIVSMVLLLGMIVALISYYNVDLTQTAGSGDEIIGVQVNMDENGDGVIDAGYERRGDVYYDEKTGSYYFGDEEEA